jgi:hypothetical protein
MKVLYSPSISKGKAEQEQLKHLPAGKGVVVQALYRIYKIWEVYGHGTKETNNK